MGQEGAGDHGSQAGVTGAALCNTAFCTADVFHGSDCSGIERSVFIWSTARVSACGCQTLSTSLSPAQVIPGVSSWHPFSAWQPLPYSAPVSPFQWLQECFTTATHQSV